LSITSLAIWYSARQGYQIHAWDLIIDSSLLAAWYHRDPGAV
jgi:hypothetical protein